ncbi:MULTISPECIES: RNA polymerase subunit sigma-70 [Pontibacillus]|uniref:RNA polymerase subunit sigma-70 n=1 Tax=Pontibacillus chungwhensis TaxID=265426 RepID=A0ABY8UWD5_9BACI|nr:MULTISPECIES: RNA polymerase subunit sigma-70 [Pontibacillus]MCD5323686.1 RNA polymerase subunit sigma-70 [Pontibacillus sp. HN14]WIF97051.1 RNA polymerase subunit sigma-70 [Pontibacillus chungwhensis]
MRQGRKHLHSSQASKDIFGVQFHDFLEKEPHLTRMEMAEEFGVSLKDVKKLKESIDRA